MTVLKQIRESFSKQTKSEKYLLSVIFLLFFIFSYYFVFNVEIGVFPDENYHLNISVSNYENKIPLIDTTDNAFGYGPYYRQPFLYHYFNAALLLLNFVNLPFSIYLRLFSPLISAL